MALGQRLPPHNIEAEQSVLGAMFIEKGAILKAMEVLQPDDFYRDVHRVIYEAMIDLFDRAEPVDIITVADELKKRGKLEQVGGLSYLTTLANLVPTAANADQYARIVEEKAILRKLIAAATEIVARCYQAQDDVAELVDQAEQAIFRVSQRRLTQGYVAVKDILEDVFERIEKAYAQKSNVTGVPTGFRDLDSLLSGLQPSDFVVVAARPSMGKTMFCLNIARNAAILHRVPVVIFSLEMAKEQLAQRLLCLEAGVDGQRLRTGFLLDSDWPRLSYALGRLSEAPLFVDDTPNITVMDIRARARRIKAEHDLGLVVVDYLQLVGSRGRPENRQQEISEISRSLKALARELKVPVVAASQLSRAVEQREDKRPLLSDLRESGAIEQDADVVAFIYRDEYYRKDSDKKNIAEIIVAKQRNGPTGSVDLVFVRETGRFGDLERRRVAEGA